MAQNNRETGTIGDVASFLNKSTLWVLDLIDRGKVESFVDIRGVRQIYLDTLPKGKELYK